MSEIELSMGYMLNWGARLVRRLADRRMKTLGLSAGHLPVINSLAENEPMSQKALAAYASIEQPTMAATLARMERDGLVERQPDPQELVRRRRGVVDRIFGRRVQAPIAR